MRAIIEHSRYTRTYFVRLDRNVVYVTTRKDDALRFAKRSGAVEIEFKERNVVRDLVKFSIMTEERAREWSREHRR